MFNVDCAFLINLWLSLFAGISPLILCGVIIAYYVLLYVTNYCLLWYWYLLQNNKFSLEIHWTSLDQRSSHQTRVDPTSSQALFTPTILKIREFLVFQHFLSSSNLLLNLFFRKKKGIKVGFYLFHRAS